jgi:N-carbamoylputrescine amidase
MNEATCAALIVHRVTADPQANLATIVSEAGAAAMRGAKLIVMSEAALTGLINNDDPSHDLPLGETVPGAATDAIGAVCRQHGVWLGIGILERENNRLYDSAVLFDPQGAIRLKYRRIQPQWHGRSASADVYRQGDQIGKVQTPFGSVAFLLCGDLFDDAVLSRFRDLRVDLLLLPFARGFSDGAANQTRWDGEELPRYAQRVRLAGAPALMVNYIGDDLPEDKSFGGAFFVSARGEVIARLPLGQTGCLLVDMKQASHKSSATKPQ